MWQRKSVRLVILVISLYLFFLSIDTMGESFISLGGGFSEKLITMTSNPFVGLMVGILTTSIIQSSSVTTSIVVCLVGGGGLTIPNAIPIVMGSNIGTTVTNALVSFGHIARKEEFRRAFAGATVHDFFNVLTVMVLFPVELKFHYLEKVATLMAQKFSDIGGLTVVSPLKVITRPVSSRILSILGPKISIIVALALLFIALRYIVVSTRYFTIDKFQLVLDKYLFKNDATSFSLGLVTTAIIQSSSVTTSIVVPLVGSGLLSLEQVYPYTLGANIGTTVTAILASLVTNQVDAVTIAFCHLLFNVTGTLIFYPLRRIPMFLARTLASVASKRKIAAIAYVVIAFYCIPLLLIYLTR